MAHEAVRTTERIAPLPPAALGIWFTEQFNGPSAVYHISFTHRLRGPLDPDRLDRALSALVHRHEPLRSRIDLIGDEPRQRVLNPAPFYAERVESKSAGELSAETERHIAEHRSRPFRLAERDPFRVLLVRLGPEDHVLSAVLHHICADGLSLPVLCADLAAFYGGLEPPPLRAGYSDVVERRLTRPPDAEALLRWRRRLAGAPPLELPTDRPRPRVRGTAGGHVPLRVGPELVERARECARRHGASLFMVLLAVFLTALRGWGGQEDLSVGVPLSGREGPEEEAMVGLFTNTVVMRVDVSGAPSFPELLRRVRSVAFDAYDDGDVPFSHVVEAVSPPRDPSRTPLFQAVFTVQDFAEDDLRLPGVTAEPLPSPGGTSEFDVELELALDGAGLVGFVQYAADLFDPASAAAFADDYLASLRRAVEESR
ncbi:hypothetical protein KCV87_33195 [Actinosynnema pretiosum subsp. pretiosum]|uniref:Condensation domain protein n=2 Tax=Actinosynnema TaxID=40566 RepID=C6WLF6_ACTMD|nr:condensation domain-containing protein [Actinosynnema mirum]ACU38349.1 condensation domain protein [Actinosynnema mirum DSM 43827]QUF04141.1 hypothetical protein KCV87_33195 [Actinosynnema pretiosum subsp. pretiosum]